MYLLIRQRHDSPFVNTFENFSQNNSNFHIKVIETNNNLKPLFQNIKLNKYLKEMEFSLCDPQIMMIDLVLWLYSKGVSNHSIHYKQFDLCL